MVPRSDRTADITLRALVTERWVLLLLLAGAGALVTLDPPALALSGWLPSRPSVPAFVALLTTWGLINVATLRWVLGSGRATQTLAGLHLLVDTTYLTVLLALSGGATNPFTTMYFVPITLATQVSPRWTWALAGYALACFAALFVLHPIPSGHIGHQMHFAGHLRGMWVAFGVSGALITYFVHRIALSLARQRAELSRLREQAVDSRHLGALGSLAAGAAHELGTPLGSIELLVAELDAMATDERSEAIETIRQQVARCKTILHRMASPHLRVTALGEHGGPPWALAELRHELEATGAPGRVRIDDTSAGTTTRLPREVLGQILRELITNALQAGEDDATVTVSLGIDAQSVTLQVSDDGPGMEAETAARAFNPFFSTRAEGEGMGLGLYLARAQVRQLGGTLRLDTAHNAGTHVTISLPSRPLSPPVEP